MKKGEKSSMHPSNPFYDSTGSQNPALLFAQRYQAFFNSTNDAIAVFSIDGDILDANPQLQTLSGFSYVHLVVRTITDLFEEESQQTIKERVQVLLEGKRRKFPLNLNLIYANGKSRPVEMSLSLLQYQYGHEYSLLAVIRDMTRRREYENRLRTRADELQKVFEMAPNILLVIDENKRIKKVNRAGIINFQKSKSNILGQRIGDVLNCVSRKDSVRGCGLGKSCRKCIIHESLLRCIKLGETVRHDVVAVKRESQDNKASYFQLSISPFLSRGAHWAVLSLNDITEKREADLKAKKLHESIYRSNLELKNTLEDLATSQSKLMEAQKLESIGLLASGLAHNLKAPLSGIKGYAQLLSMDYKDLHELQMILREVESMEAIINNLMLKNRRGHQDTEETLQLNDLIRLEHQFLEANMFYKHQVEKVLDLEENLPCVRGIYNHFSQILMNIVQNSLDAMYSSNKKKLIITTRFDNHFVYVDIEDTGSGIPKEIQDSVFDIFFSTKPNNVQRKGDEPVGTGLGLSSANYFIQQYGGRIELDSKAGRGTKITVCVPVDNEKELPESHRILVIDDSAAVVNVIVKACKKLGYETYGTQDSENALDLYNKVTPELIITDLIMPKMTGSELMIRIREWNPEQKVIYLSGYLDNPDFNEWLERESANQFTAVISKPVVWDAVKEKINEFME